MAKFLRSSSSSKSIGGRAVPLMLLGQAAMVLRDHWGRTSAADRSRLAELLKTSKGRPANLTPAQKKELAAIVKRADLKGLGRDLAPIAARRGGRGPLGRR